MQTKPTGYIGRTDKNFSECKLVYDDLCHYVKQLDDMQYLEFIFDMPEEIQAKATEVFNWLCDEQIRYSKLIQELS